MPRIRGRTTVPANLRIIRQRSVSGLDHEGQDSLCDQIHDSWNSEDVTRVPTYVSVPRKSGFGAAAV